MRYLFADDVFVSEADGTATIVLRLDAPADSQFVVNYSNVGGYASPSNSTDYVSAAGAVTFLVGETQKSVQFQITNNSVAESSENFWLTLSLPSASIPLVTLTRSQIPVTIVDNDSAAGGTPIVSVRDVAVDESSSLKASFVLTLDRPPTASVTVNWQTANGSAIAGQDYVGAGGTVTFLAGDTSQTVDVTLIDDALPERSEQFRVFLSTPVGVTIGVGEAVATIGANDAPVNPKPMLFVDDVTVSEADAYAEMVLRLDAPSASAITVNYTTNVGYATSSNSSDYIGLNSSVTFAPGQTLHMVRIPIDTADLTPEPQENFWFVVSVPVASQTLVTLSRSQIPVTIVDNDSTLGGPPIVSVRGVTVDETTSEYARFVVVLDRPSSTIVKVDWTTMAGSALAGQDFVGNDGTVVFLPGDTAQTIEVVMVDDALIEGSEQFRIQLSAPVGAVIGNGLAVATIGANDAPVVPRPMLFVDDVTVSEADAYAEMVLRLDAPSASQITVNYTTNVGYATSSNSSDYIGLNSSVTFAPGQTVQSVLVPIGIFDTASENQENFWFVVSLPVASQTLVTLARTEIPVTIVDNDSTLGGTPIVTVRDVTVDETTSEYARFVVVLDRPSSSVVTVNWQTANGSATAGQDFTAANGTVIFLPGDTAQTIEVAMIDDALAERSEQFRLQLSAPVGATIGIGEAVATIGANDGVAVPRPMLFVDDVTVSEGDGYAEMVLRLDAPSASQFSVTYATAVGYATSSNSSDYIGVGSTIVFAPGQAVQSVLVPIGTANLTPENQENFWFTLSVPAASQTLVTLARTEIPVTIVDNDSTLGGVPIVSVRDVTVDETTSEYARFVVVLDRPSSAIVTVNWQTVSGSATAFDDFVGANGTVTFLPGDTAQTVEIALIDDALAERSEQFRLQLSTPAGATIGIGEAVATIGANDGVASLRPMVFVDDVTVSEGDAYAEMVLRLDAPSTSQFTVNYATSVGYATSSNSSDYIGVGSAITFAPGQTVQSVLIPIGTTDLNPENQENFWFTLSVPAASQTLVALSRSQIPVTIVDNDSLLGGVPIVSVRGVVVDETTSEYARFVVVLDRPSSSIVTVNWQTASGSATAFDDFVGANGTVTFLPGDTSQTVEIALINDALVEGPEKFSLQLSSPVGATIGLGEAVATIAASDRPVSLKPTLFVDDAVVSEADGFAEMLLQLDAPSASAITVNYTTAVGWATSSNSADYIGLNSSVTFAAGQTAAVVKIPIGNDTAVENFESFWFVVSLSVASQTLVTLSRTEIPVAIIDNDSLLGGTPAASVRDVVVDESSSHYARFTVTLDRPSTSVVTVNWETANGTALAGQDYVAATGTLTFIPGDTAQSFEIALIDDQTPEIAEQFDIQLTAATGATIAVRSATATIASSDLSIIPKPILLVDGVTVSEADGFAEVVLRLNAQSASAITVNYVTASSTATASNSADFIGVGSSVTFVPGQMVYVIKVPITNDITSEAQEQFNFNLSLPAASVPLVTLAQTQVPVVIVDDDSGFRVLSQGAGNDTYIVTTASDWIVELAKGGIDTVETSLNNYTLPENVENLRLLGAANINGNGNALNNTFYGNSGNNVFNGGAGFDVVEFAAPASQYAFAFNGDGSITANHLAGGQGIDTLISIEGARFPDIGYLEIADFLAQRDAITVFATAANGQIRFTTSTPERTDWLADPGLIHLPQFQFTFPLYGVFAPPNTLPVYRFHDPVADQYFWTSSNATRDDFLANQHQLWYDGAVAQGYVGRDAALAGGGIGISIHSLVNTNTGGIGSFVLTTAEGAAALVGQPGIVDYGIAFWL